MPPGPVIGLQPDGAGSEAGGDPAPARQAALDDGLLVARSPNRQEM